MPSGWSVIHEYTKTAVTLAVALLGLTVTFSKDLLGTDAALEYKEYLFLAWGFFASSILFSILSTASLSNYLRRVSNDSNKAILYANITFFSLLFGGVALAYFVSAATLYKTSNKNISQQNTVNTEKRIISIQTQIVKHEALMESTKKEVEEISKKLGEISINMNCLTDYEKFRYNNCLHWKSLRYSPAFQ